MLEEMPPFPERESSILAKLKKKKGPNTVTDLEEAKRERSADVNGGPEPAPASAVVGALLLGGLVPESQGQQSTGQFENSVFSVRTCAQNEAVRPSLGLHLSFARDLQKLFSLRHCGPSSRTSFRLLSSVQGPLPVPLCLVFGSDDAVTYFCGTALCRRPVQLFLVGLEQTEPNSCCS